MKTFGCSSWLGFLVMWGAAWPLAAETGGGEVAELKAMVRELGARVRELEGEVAVLKAGPAGSKVVDGAAQAAAQPGASFALGSEGFAVSDASGEYRLEAHGVVQMDGRFPLGDDIDSGDDSTFYLRRVRPCLAGTLGGLVDFGVQFELSQNVVLLDAWGDLRLADEALKLRFGQFKTPLGLERSLPAADRWFVENSLAFDLTPGRDQGLELHGLLDDGAWLYRVGLFNGVNDGRRPTGGPDTNEGFDLYGSVFAQPFRNCAGSPLAGLGVGLAGSWGTEDGPASSAGVGPVRYRSPARDEFFRIETDGTRCDGERSRLNPQLYYFHGPFGLLAEYVHSSQDLVRDDEARVLDTDAWMVETLWVLTGEDAVHGAPVVEHPFGRGGGWGWWGLAARYSALDVGSGAFEGDDATRLAADGSAGDANEWGLSLIWYPISNFKWMLGFEQTLFSGHAGDPDGDRQTENIILTRLQLAF